MCRPPNRQGQHVILVMAFSIGLVILQIFLFTALGSGIALSGIVPLAIAPAGARRAGAADTDSNTMLTRDQVSIHPLAVSVAALVALGVFGGGGRGRTLCYAI
jgi:hypothetical protein